jgi:hypothetical protein
MDFNGGTVFFNMLFPYFSIPFNTFQCVAPQVMRERETDRGTQRTDDQCGRRHHVRSAVFKAERRQQRRDYECDG